MKDCFPTRGRNESKPAGLRVKGGSPEHPSRRPQQTRIKRVRERAPPKKHRDTPLAGTREQDETIELKWAEDGE